MRLVTGSVPLRALTAHGRWTLPLLALPVSAALCPHCSAELGLPIHMGHSSQHPHLPKRDTQAFFLLLTKPCTLYFKSSVADYPHPCHIHPCLTPRLPGHQKVLTVYLPLVPSHPLLLDSPQTAPKQASLDQKAGTAACSGDPRPTVS